MYENVTQISLTQIQTMIRYDCVCWYICASVYHIYLMKSKSLQVLTQLPNFMLILNIL